MTWGAWVLVHDTGTTTGVIFRSSYDFPGRHGLGWDRNTWPGIAQLINARVASWWHVRGGGTLVGTPGLAEMPDLDTGTTKVTAAPTIGCCTGTTWAGVAGPRAILTGLSWLDTWLPARSTLTRSLGVLDGVDDCDLLDAPLHRLHIHWCDHDLGGTRQYGRLLTALPTRSIPFLEPWIQLSQRCASSLSFAHV